MAAWHADRALASASPGACSFSSAGTGDDDAPALPTGGWAPHALAAAWALNTLLLVVPCWTAATALPYAALAVLSALEATVAAPPQSGQDPGHQGLKIAR